jgi:hypothetical protein
MHSLLSHQEAICVAETFRRVGTICPSALSTVEDVRNNIHSLPESTEAKPPRPISGSWFAPPRFCAVRTTSNHG